MNQQVRAADHAFPSGSSTGITLRDYYIAHAPAMPQAWFKPAMPSRPEPVIVRDPHGNSTVTNQAAIDAWQREFNKQWFVQWPAAWADAVLGQPDTSLLRDALESMLAVTETYETEIDSQLLSAAIVHARCVLAPQGGVA